jgi:hypothetical protein
MNDTHYIEDANRTARRKQRKSLGFKVIDYVVELVTNSDDSYKRMESKGLIPIEGKKPIYIELKKSRDHFVISVTDNAEGLENEQILKIFGKYGGDNAGGENVASRGIFGQGATDVMVNAAMDKKQAMLESIKDGAISKYYFGWDEQTGKRFIKNKPINFNKGQFEEFRKKSQIPLNGTIMTFGIPSSVKFNESTLIDDIQGSHYLRYILSSQNREVYFIKGNKKQLLTSSNYLLSDDLLLKKYTFGFNYSDTQINGTLFLYRNKLKAKSPEYKTDILVSDTNEVIYANTMFGFEKMAKARDISGKLVIDGLYSLCKKHLNQEYPDEIINDDRTGFNTKHEFYQILTNKYIDSYIKDCINEYGADIDELDISKNKKFQNALSAINKWMSEELKRDIPGGGLAGKTPPVDGLDFGKNTIYITKNATYDLKLIINPSLIAPEDDIIIEVANNFDNVTFTPDVINYNSDEIDGNNIVKKSISINAKKITYGDNYVVLTASSKSFTKSISINIVELDIFYPKNGIGFESEDATFVEGINHKTNVWFDLSTYGLGTEITVYSENLNIITTNIVLNEEMIIVDNLGKFEVFFNGGNLGGDYLITVKVLNDGFEVSQRIHIRNHSKPTIGSKGMFTAIKLWVEEGHSFQTTFDYKTGIIYVNARSPINISMMGDLLNTDPEKPNFNEKQLKYLSDLIAFQCAIIDVKELERKNQIEISEEDRLEDYLGNLYRKKMDVYERILKAMQES